MEIDYNSEIQGLEKEILKNERPSSINLIKETFIVWYSLVEGNTLIEEGRLQEILNRNINLIKKFYSKDPELIFLQGWMMQISSWFFDSDGSDFGEKYLRLAHKYRPDNLLFKWALRDNMNLSRIELEVIKSSLEKGFDKYYVNYKPIEEYFKGIVATS